MLINLIIYPRISITILGANIMMMKHFNLINFFSLINYILYLQTNKSSATQLTNHDEQKIIAIVDESSSLSHKEINNYVKVIINRLSCNNQNQTSDKPVALIAFSSNATLKADFTYDLNAIEKVLQLPRNINSSNKPNTNIAKALNLARQLMQPKDIILLVSDMKTNLPKNDEVAKRRALEEAKQIKQLTEDFICLTVGKNNKNRNKNLSDELCEKQNRFRPKQKNIPPLCDETIKTTSIPTVAPTLSPTQSPTSIYYPKLLLVLDQSGSITKIMFNTMVNFIVNNMGCPKAREICIISFATKPVMAMECTNDQIKLIELLRTLTPYNKNSNNGETNIARALRFTREHLNNKEDNMVVLFSDGKTNAPGNDNQAYKEAITQAEKLRNRSLFFSCVNIGLGNNNLLNEMCQENLFILDDIKNTTNNNPLNFCPSISMKFSG